MGRKWNKFSPFIPLLWLSNKVLMHFQFVFIFFAKMSSVNYNCALGLIPLMSSRCLQATKKDFARHLKRRLQFTLTPSTVFAFTDSLLVELKA